MPNDYEWIDFLPKIRRQTTKRLFALVLAFMLIPTHSLAGGWWDDWRGDDRYERNDPISDAYEEGYEFGFSDGTEDPFYFDDDKAGAFGHWFLRQEWTPKELHAWKAVFNAMFDDFDRTDLEYKDEYDNPVYVAIVTGTVYHTTEECSKLSISYMVETLEIEDAVKRGFNPCKTCAKE